MPLLCVGERRSPTQLDDDSGDNEEDAQECTSIWQEAPDSILLHIFSFLEVKDLGLVSQTCKVWNRVSYDESLWRNILRTFLKLSDCHLPPGKLSWQQEVKRIQHHAPVLLTETLTDHTDEVLHVSFSHNGQMFSTTSKDASLKVWDVGYPTTLKYSKDFRELLGWDFTQFSCFNESDTMVLVSSVKTSDYMDRRGYMAILSLIHDFDILRVVTMDPSQLFGAWLDDATFLGGSLEISLDRFATTVQIEAFEVPEIFSPIPCPSPIPTVEESAGRPLFTFSSETASLIKFLTVAVAPSLCTEVQQQTGSAESSCKEPGTLTQLVPSPHSCSSDQPCCIPKSSQGRMGNSYDFALSSEDTGNQLHELNIKGYKDTDDNECVTQANIEAIKLNEKSEKNKSCQNCGKAKGNIDNSECFDGCIECNVLGSMSQSFSEIKSPGTGIFIKERKHFSCENKLDYVRLDSDVPVHMECDSMSKRPFSLVVEEKKSTGSASNKEDSNVTQPIKEDLFIPEEETQGAGIMSTSMAQSTENLVKNLIFVTGEFAVALHQLGFKNVPPYSRECVFSRGGGVTPMDEDNPESFMVVNYSNNDIHIVRRQQETDKPDSLIDLFGHVTGLCLTSDQRYLFINCRPWIGDIDRTDPWATPDLSPNIEVRIIDLLTLKDLGVRYTGHKGYSPSNMCCFVFLDVSDDYVASGSEDARGYLWDRHYQTQLAHYNHTSGVVNAVGFSPIHQEYLVTVSDDGSVKIWRSRSEVQRLQIPVNNEESKDS